MDKPLVSVVICTRNRKDEVLKTIASCYAQDYEPLEVLVFDDASTDGTEEAVRTQYPDVKLVRVNEVTGQSGLRDKGFREAGGEYVFSLDDDAYYTASGTMGMIVDVLDAHPEVGAVAMPFIEPTRGEVCAVEVEPGSAVRSFYGCSYAVRRQAALDAGGYRDFFHGQGEERDLCIRLMDAGSSIVYGASPPVVHNASVFRDQRRADFLGVRNTLLFDSLNIPQPYMVPRLLSDAGKLLFYKLRLRTLPRRLWFVLRGLAACIRYAGERKTVSAETYRRYRSLPGHAPVPWSKAVPGPAEGVAE